MSIEENFATMPFREKLANLESQYSPCPEHPERTMYQAYFLGRVYAHGREEVNRDEAKAARYLTDASNYGCGRASFMLYIYCNKNSSGFSTRHDLYAEFKDRAIRLLPQQARADITDAAYFLGCLFSYGLLSSSNEPDYREALYWLEREASRGHLAATQHIAYFYAHGFGTPRDLFKAYKCFDVPFERGITVARVKQQHFIRQFTREEQEQVRAMATSEELSAEVRKSIKKSPPVALWARGCATVNSRLEDCLVGSTPTFIALRSFLPALIHEQFTSGRRRWQTRYFTRGRKRRREI